MSEPVATTDTVREDSVSSAKDAQEPIHSEPRAPWASAIAMAEAGLLTDVGVVFDLAWIYLPILGAAFAPLIPTPFAILYLRRGARISIFAGCVAGFLMTVMVGPHYGWRLTLEAILGIALGWAMERRWPPIVAIGLGLVVNSTVAYVAAFGAVFALGLPLKDLYLDLQNVLRGVDWLVGVATRLAGVHAQWLSIRPEFAAAGHFTLAHWIPMFYLYVVAIALPIDVLYYSVASTTAYALGHDVRPFPPPWVWRVVGGIGLLLRPLFWLVRMVWRLLTVPVWGPVWVARALGRRRQRKRLADELAALAAPNASGKECES